MLHRNQVLLVVALAGVAAACRLPAQRGEWSERATSETARIYPSAPPPVVNPNNPLAAYVPPSVADEFNPDVTDAERRHPQPRRGGSLIVRMPSDLRTVNPLLQTTLEEMTVISYITEYPESLIHRDSETLEYMPRMAEYWAARDYIEQRDGTRVEGLITTQTSQQVVIAPGASIWTFFLKDLVSSDTKTGEITTRFGHKLRGEFQTFTYTIIVTEKPNAPPLTLAMDQLSTWTDTTGVKPRVRASIKPHCIYEFRLRPGIRWHDGHPVTMEDAQCGYDTIMNPKVDCAALRPYYLDIEQMEVPDPMTAKFSYRKPYFASQDFIGSIIFLPKHILQPERFRDDPEGYAEFFNKHPMGQPGTNQFVGLGPYKLDHWTAGQEIALVRSEDYWACKANLPWWDPQRPYLDKLTWRIIHEKTPALRELENGNVDADFDIEPDTWVLPSTHEPSFTSRYVRAKFISPGYTFMGYNEERDLFKDKMVRRALGMLTPRDEILTTIHYGLGFIDIGPFFYYGPCADRSVKPLPYDPAEARRILRRAGWIDRDGDGILDKDGQKFEFEYLIHTARAYHALIADIVKQYWSRAGIQVNIRKIDPTVFNQTVTDHNFDAVRYAWTDVLDGDPYQIWHSSQSKDRGSNFISYANPRMDELIEKGREEFDPLKRWAMFREVYDILCDDQPMTFLFTFDNLTFYHKRYRGVKFYKPFPGYDYTEWYVGGQK